MRVSRSQVGVHGTPPRQIECMSRLGQGDLGLRSHRVGTVWIRDISADLALHPRLALAAGCQLQEVAARPPVADLRPASETIVGFKIASLGGQLRWQLEQGPVIGDLSFPKGLEHVRSAAYPSEHEFTMCCDVAPRVFRARRGRAGRGTTCLLDGPRRGLGDRWTHRADLSNTLAFRRARRHVALILGGIGLS